MFKIDLQQLRNNVGGIEITCLTCQNYRIFRFGAMIHFASAFNGFRCYPNHFRDGARWKSMEPHKLRIFQRLEPYFVNRESSRSASGAELVAEQNKTGSTDRCGAAAHPAGFSRNGCQLSPKPQILRMLSS